MDRFELLDEVGLVVVVEVWWLVRDGEFELVFVLGAGWGWDILSLTSVCL